MTCAKPEDRLSAGDVLNILQSMNTTTEDLKKLCLENENLVPLNNRLKVNKMYFSIFRGILKRLYSDVLILFQHNTVDAHGPSDGDRRLYVVLGSGY